MNEAEAKRALDLLFTPLTVRGKVFRNRVVMAPTVSHRGIVTPEGLEWYGGFAQGGAALVIIEATPVYRFDSELNAHRFTGDVLTDRGMTIEGLEMKKLTVDRLGRLADAIHAGGALAAVQLYPDLKVLIPRDPASQSAEQIEELIRLFARAAGLCGSAGFDGVQIHGAHGYMLNRFFSPVQNTRTDAFGGSLENRMRLASRIVEAVKPVCEESGMLLLYRHTPVGKGYTLADSLALGGRLVEAGVDVLDLSPASAAEPADRAAPFKTLGVPVVAVNRMDEPERFGPALSEGRADLIAVCRGMIADPDWPRKMKEGRPEEIVRCIRCNELCFGNLRKWIPIACTQWEGAPRDEPAADDEA